MRPAERLFVAYFAYVVLLGGVIRDRPHLGLQPVLFLAMALVSFWLLERGQRGRWEKPIQIARDWLPIVFLLAAFRVMEAFAPARFDLRLESGWIRLDQMVLGDWGWRAAIESAGKLGPFYLELCYLVVYGLAAIALGCIAGLRSRRAVDYFWLVYLTGTLAAYALFPFFPSAPPRIVFPAVEPPQVTTWVRTFNLFILRDTTIHTGVFPSAHVSSAFSAAWAFYFLFPGKRWPGYAMTAYAMSVSLATIYGRYHYVADVLAGFAVSLVALAAALAIKGRYVQKH